MQASSFVPASMKYETDRVKGGEYMVRARYRWVWEIWFKVLAHPLLKGTLWGKYVIEPIGRREDKINSGQVMSDLIALGRP